VSPGNDRAPQPADQGAGGSQNLDTDKGTRFTGPPCGCESSAHECGIGRPIPTTRRHVEAARAAYRHLAFCGLVDSEGFVAGVLRPGGVRAA
jgi:hypothetical protein